jgi:hypothetical protein
MKANSEERYALLEVADQVRAKVIEKFNSDAAKIKYQTAQEGQIKLEMMTAIHDAVLSLNHKDIVAYYEEGKDKYAAFNN